MRRFLSHILISIATFVLMATFFMWTIDARVLNPETLSAELRKAGVGQEIANILPNALTADPESSQDEKERVQQIVTDAVSAQYVEDKVHEVAAEVLHYIRGESTTAIIDLTDFGDRLQELAPEEAGELDNEDTPLSEPINLNEEGQLDNIRRGYEIFTLVKYIGVGLFVGLLLLEAVVAQRGQKLRRVSRIFLYAGLSYIIYWGLLIGVPKFFPGLFRKSVSAEFDTTAVTDAVVAAVQGLFSMYFLGFGIACLIVALILYLIRHFKHGDVLAKQGDQP